MDIIVYLKNTAGSYSFCTSNGGNISQAPSLTRNAQSNLILTFLDENGGDLTLPTCSSFDFAADLDWTDSTVPKILVVSGITQSANTVIIPVKPSSNELVTAITGKEFLFLNAELKGYQLVNSEPIPVFPVKFKLVIANSIYNGTGTPSETPDDYYTKPQVDALFVGLENKIKAANVYQYSADGETWHDAPRVSTDTVYHERKNVEGALYGASLPLPRAELIIDTKTYNFSTTAESANPLVISKETLGIASDAEPQVSVWLVNVDGSKQLAGDSVIPVKSYTADGTGLSLTYYQTAWPVANWQIKMS